MANHLDWDSRILKWGSASEPTRGDTTDRGAPTKSIELRTSGDQSPPRAARCRTHSPIWAMRGKNASAFRSVDCTSTRWWMMAQALQARRFGCSTPARCFSDTAITICPGEIVPLDISACSSPLLFCFPFLSCPSLSLAQDNKPRANYDLIASSMLHRA